MKNGWYNNNNTYFTSRPLHNGARQQFVMFASNIGQGRYNIAAGVFPYQATLNSIKRNYNDIWENPTSTNKKVSTYSITCALDCLKEVEEAIAERANGKRRLIEIDGSDYRRLHAYTRILTKEKYGYKVSSVKSLSCNLHILIKTINAK